MSRSPATSEESSEAEQSIPTIFHSLHKSSSGKQTVPTAQSPKSTQSPPHEPKQPIFEELHCSPTDSHQLLFNTPPFPHSLLSAATSSSLPRPTPRPPSRQSPTLRPSGKEVETDTLGSFELVGIDEIEAVDTGHFNASSPFSSSPFTASLSRFSVSVPSDTATISFLPQNSPSDTQSLGLGMSTARNEPKQERSACRLRDLRLDRSADLRLDFSGSEPRLTLLAALLLLASFCLALRFVAAVSAAATVFAVAALLFTAFFGTAAVGRAAALCAFRLDKDFDVSGLSEARLGCLQVALACQLHKVRLAVDVQAAHAGWVFDSEPFGDCGLKLGECDGLGCDELHHSQGL
ncbi:hypothetical protein BLNAU_1135 [Blattamonas nauphoetae]|uniref:Uncharacterized protein n=1 Tax=Blattamonas nauphoetae TaxID=2049346 RepID=A0ABQ9YKF3_9EUKA|nr:hypothetical protein BLNAU_1135 [Blattamonas nauphoetae]